jgi:apolipoprotein D and lipocalin family protein
MNASVKWYIAITTLLAIFHFPGMAMATEKPGPLHTVPSVDLNRYLGVWYEIASYPAWFQKGCTGSTADYSLLPNGRIQVINRCFKNSWRAR